MLTRVFPVDYDATHDLVHELPLSIDAVERSIFLDNRIAADLSAARVVQRRLLPPVPLPDRGGLLLHTSFCGSTLLAKALHDREGLIALREPFVLRRLADASFRGQDIAAVLPDLVRRVAQPWPNGATVLVKPTHAALPLAAALMDALPRWPVLALTSSLEDFMLSNLRKPEDTRRRVGELVHRQAGGNPLDPGRIALPSAPDFLDAVALQWSLQREWLGLLQRRFPGRVRMIDAEAFYGAPQKTLIAASEWLGVPLGAEAAARRLEPLLGVHSKAPDLAYDATVREQHNAAVRQAADGALRRALARWRSGIRPAMSVEALQPGEA